MCKRTTTVTADDLSQSRVCTIHEYASRIDQLSPNRSSNRCSNCALLQLTVAIAPIGSAHSSRSATPHSVASTVAVTHARSSVLSAYACVARLPPTCYTDYSLRAVHACVYMRRSTVNWHPSSCENGTSRFAVQRNIHCSQPDESFHCALFKCQLNQSVGMLLLCLLLKALQQAALTTDLHSQCSICINCNLSRSMDWRLAIQLSANQKRWIGLHKTALCALRAAHVCRTQHSRFRCDCAVQMFIFTCFVSPWISVLPACRTCNRLSEQIQ